MFYILLNSLLREFAQIENIHKKQHPAASQ